LVPSARSRRGSQQTSKSQPLFFQAGRCKKIREPSQLRKLKMVKVPSAIGAAYL
jgi:hypothetical protein